MTERVKLESIMPISYEVEAGACYRWCGCGKSTTRPLCDGKSNCLLSIDYIASLTETLSFCGCGQTMTPPLCDGTHGKILLSLLKKPGSEFGR